MKRHLDIDGMHCASCARSVEKELQGVEGVREATVNFASGRAQIECEELVEHEELVEAVRRAGYNVHEHHDHAAVEEYSRSRMLWTWAFTVPIMILMIVGYLGVHVPYMHVIIFTLAIPPVLLFGAPVHRATWRSLQHLRANMDTLITLGTLSAFVAGILAFFIAVPDFAGIAAGSTSRTSRRDEPPRLSPRSSRSNRKQRASFAAMMSR